MAADGGQPATEAVGVAAEPVEVAEPLRPGLARHVLGIVAPDEHREVAEQPRLDVAVHGPQRRFVAREHLLYERMEGIERLRHGRRVYLTAARSASVRCVSAAGETTSRCVRRT